MPLGASPSLVACFSLDNNLGCHGHPQAQALLTPYSFIHRDLTQNLKTSITQNSTKLREIRQYKKINHHFKYCCELILNSYQHYIYCNPTSPWFIPPDTTHRFIKIREQCIENRICQNRPVCSNLYIPYRSDISKKSEIQEVVNNMYVSTV